MNICDKHILELKNINKSLDYLYMMLTTELDSMYEHHEKLSSMSTKKFFFEDHLLTNNIFNTSQDDKDNHINDRKKEDFNDIISVASTILEALLVRQVSVVEKYLVELSFFVYKRCTKEIDIIFHPPNMHLENEEVFSDCIKATISIKNNINFNIKNLNNWKIFKKLRDLRHKLAHGERTICLGNDELDEYNKKFKQALFIEHKITCNKNKKEYTLNTKFDLMIEINNLFISFIKEIDREMKKIILL